MVVVMKAWGSVPDAAHEVGAAHRIELAEDVVEQEQWRFALRRGEQVHLGQLEGQDGGALLAARGEGGQGPSVELEDDVVAVRADERGAVPELLVGRLGEPAAQRVGRALVGGRPARWSRSAAPGGPRPVRSPHARRPSGAASAASAARRASTTMRRPRRR